MDDFLTKFFYLVAALPIFYGLCAAVQVTVLKPKSRYMVILAFCFAAFFIGLMGLLLRFAGPPIQNVRSGNLLLIFAVLTILPMFKQVRQLFGRITPLDPNSMVDISGLIVSFWFILVMITTIVAVDLNTLKDQVKLTVADAIINVLAFPALAACLVGIWITRSPREVVKRLGLERLTLRQVGVSLGLVVPILIFGVGLDAVGQRLQPELYEQLQDVLKAMSSNITNPAIALVIGVSAGIGEEILFRGAIQPRLGIWLTAVLFALSHAQYGASYAIASVFLIGFVLGYQRKYMNTTACIVTHGTYDVIAFLLAYLAGSGG